MVSRVNGAPAQGVYFSKDVRFLLVDTDNTTFLTDLTVAGTADVVNSNLEITLEQVATRGTIIGVSVVDGGNVQVIVDYAQAYDDAAVEAAVEAAVIAATAATTCAITVFEGFAGAALGTPA